MDVNEQVSMMQRSCQEHEFIPWCGPCGKPKVYEDTCGSCGETVQTYVCRFCDLERNHER